MLKQQTGRYLNQVDAAEARLTPDMVRFSPEIEPIVQLIEETPRDRCVPMTIDRILRRSSARGSRSLRRK